MARKQKRCPVCNDNLHFTNHKGEHCKAYTYECRNGCYHFDRYNDLRFERIGETVVNWTKTESKFDRRLRMTRRKISLRLARAIFQRYVEVMEEEAFEIRDKSLELKKLCWLKHGF